MYSRLARHFRDEGNNIGSSPSFVPYSGDNVKKRQRGKTDDIAVLIVDKIDGFAEESTSQEILQKIDQALVTLTDRFGYLDDRDDMVLEHLIMVHSEMAVGMG